MKVRYQKIEINGKNVKWNYTDQTLVEITQHDEEEKNQLQQMAMEKSRRIGKEKGITSTEMKLIIVCTSRIITKQRNQQRQWKW